MSYRVVLGATSGRISGVDVFTIHLARGLKAAGIDVTVLMTEAGSAVPDPLPFPDDIPVTELPRRRGTSFPARWRAVASLLESWAPCIYVPNYDFAHSPASALLPGEVGVVGVIHSDDPVHYDHVARLGRYWNRIVSVSPAIDREVARRHPELRDRLATIPYGVPVPDGPRPRPARPHPLRVLYAGRLVQHQKRVFDLVRIADATAASGTPVEFAIAGSGEDEVAFREACAPLVARGVVRFLGTLPNADVLRACAESDAFILTSEFEGLPVSLLEAMAAGCVPVVTGIRSGIPDVVRDGENGFLLPVGDVAGFADRLARLHREPGLLGRLSAAAHATIAQRGYSTAAMTASYRAEFDRVWEDHNAGRWRRPHGEPVPPAWMLPLWKHHVPMPIRRATGQVLTALGIWREPGR